MLGVIFAMSDDALGALVIIPIVTAIWYFTSKPTVPPPRSDAYLREQAERQDKLARLTHCQACGNALGQVGAAKCASCGEWQKNIW